MPPASAKQQVQEGASAGTLASQAYKGVAEILSEAGELVEREIRARFKRMCEGYYENVSKKLIKEHKVCVSSLWDRLVFQFCVVALVGTRSSKSRGVHTFRRNF